MSESFMQGQFSKDKSVYIGSSLSSFPDNRLGYGITNGEWGFTPVGVLVMRNDLNADPYFDKSSRVGDSLLAIPSKSIYWASSGSTDTWYTNSQAKGMMESKSYMNSTSFYLGDTGDGVDGYFANYWFDYYVFKDLEGLYFDAMYPGLQEYSSNFACIDFLCQLRSKAGMTKYEIH